MEKVYEVIKAIVGEDYIISEIDQMNDLCNKKYQPDFLVYPKTPEEIVKIVRISNELKVPVYPVGSGSFFEHGIESFKGGIVLSTQRLKKIIEYRPLNLSVEVEAGVTIKELEEILEKDNLFYPVDVNLTSTIGGQISSNRYGRKKYMYKSTRFYVMGMEFISPEGEIIKVGGRTVKNVTGYDISQLLAGGWGNFGIITKATLRLRPIPEEKVKLSFVTKEFSEFNDMIGSLYKEKINLASIKYQKVSEEYQVVVELEGFKETVNQQVGFLSKKYNMSTKKIDFNDERYLGKISLTLENYCDGLEILEQLANKQNTDLKLKGNATNGIIHFDIENCKEEFIQNIAYFTRKLDGTFIYRDRVLSHVKRGKGYISILQAIKEKVDPNNILVPQSKVLRGGLK